MFSCNYPKYSMNETLLMGFATIFVVNRYQWKLNVVVAQSNYQPCTKGYMPIVIFEHGGHFL